MACFCTKRERSRWIWSLLVAATSVVCCALLILSLKYTGHYSSRVSNTERLVKNECEKICLTKECLLQAKLLNSLLDSEVDPCEDFYAFSCGNYVRRFGKEDNVSTFQEFTDRIFLELKDVLDNLNAPPESAAGKMKTVYDSCVDVGSSELSAMATIRDFLNEVGLRGWPDIGEDFQFSDPGLPKVLGTLAAYQEFSFLQFFSTANDDEVPVYNGSVQMARFVRAPEYREILIPELIKLVVQYVDGINFQSIEEINAFMSDKLKIYLNCKERDENSRGLFIHCSEETDSGWILLCEMMKSFAEAADVKSELSDETIFLPCFEINSTRGILDILQEAPHRVLANSIALSLFVSHFEELNLPLRLEFERIQRRVLDSDVDYEPVPLVRWRRCVDWVGRNMPLALGAQYIREVVTEQVFRQVHGILKELFDESQAMIREQRWLTEEEKNFIFDEFEKYRLLSTDLQMTYYLNDTFVNEYYKGFNPTRKSFLANVLERQRAAFGTDFKFRDRFRGLHKLKPFSLNARFTRNFLDFGLGNFRFPTYDRESLRIFNLVRLSAVFGHEIGHFINHAFDELVEKERMPEGKMAETNSCFQMQYSNFTIESLGKPVDADLTSMENYADSISVMLVDRIIDKYGFNAISDDSTSGYILPSLPLNTKQLFYSMLTQTMCSKYSQEKEKLFHERDPHAPDNFRFTAMMQNSDGFSRANNCSAESYMNPRKKCHYVKSY